MAHIIQIWTSHEGNSTKYMPEGVWVDNYLYILYYIYYIYFLYSAMDCYCDIYALYNEYISINQVWTSFFSWCSQCLYCCFGQFFFVQPSRWRNRAGVYVVGYMLFTPDRRVDPCLHSGHPPRPQLPPSHSNWVPGLGFEPRSSSAIGLKTQLL